MNKPPCCCIWRNGRRSRSQWTAAANQWTDGCDGEWSAPVEVVGQDAKRAPLTIRTIDEILDMTFDPADLILLNGYATKGDIAAMCGIGGIGKSRLAMQFALYCRAARDF